MYKKLLLLDVADETDKIEFVTLFKHGNNIDGFFETAKSNIDEFLLPEFETDVGMESTLSLK